MFSTARFPFTRLQGNFTIIIIGRQNDNLLLEINLVSCENSIVKENNDNSAESSLIERAAGRGRIRLASVGDILLCTDPRGQVRPRDGKKLFAGVTSTFAQSDIAIGNLECTLAGNGGRVPTEPRVVSSAELVRSVKEAGIQIVTLANNHAFDCLQAGFGRTRRLLDETGIAYFGAGDTLTEATAPVILEVAGIRLGFIGAVDRRTGVRQIAEPEDCGVAPLDIEHLAGRIGELRREVDHVIVSVHWGEERFQIPSPIQVEQAHRLVDAGASLVLGHHPHVLQGLERYQGAVIIYSLGNFVASEVLYSDGDSLTWNRTERTGCILQVEMDSEKIYGTKQVLTYDNGESVEIDTSRFGRKLLNRLNQSLARGVTLKRYRWEHLRIKTIKPVLSHLRWRNLKRLRLRQIRNAWAGIFSAIRAK